MDVRRVFFLVPAYWFGYAQVYYDCLGTDAIWVELVFIVILSMRLSLSLLRSLRERERAGSGGIEWAVISPPARMIHRG